MADTVERATKQIRERLRELEPLVEEQRRLQRALEALEQVGGRSTRGRTSTPKISPRRRRRTSSGRARRGERREQLLEAIRANPGSKPADLARTMGVAPSQAHSLLGRLQESGEVERREGGLFVGTGGGTETSGSAGTKTPQSAKKTEPNEGESLRERETE